jgi:signal transduction histidine kinase
LPVTGVRLSLWRAVALLRVITLVFCLVLIVRWRDIYARPAVAFAVGVAMVVVTAVVGWLAVRGRAHRPSVVFADLAITVVLTLATIWAQLPSQRFDTGMPTLTTLWAAGPVIEVGYLFGWLGGVLAGLVQFGAALVVRGGYDGRTLTSGVLLVTVGAVTGYVASLTIRAEGELADAVAARAALVERERLARSIHDGVLQVLGLVHRRGREAGGDWALLAAAAAEQEAALRRLITSQPEPATTGRGDLAAELRALATDRVTVGVPATPVLLEADATAELTAAVRATLDNVAQHAGPSARAWVLLDAFGDTVQITVRDDGVGMADGRLAEATAQGRLGIAGSITRRVADLGGRATVVSTQGEGTVVELTVPVRR